MADVSERIGVEPPRDGDHVGTGSIGIAPAGVTDELDALRAEVEKLRARLRRCSCER